MVCAATTPCDIVKISAQTIPFQPRALVWSDITFSRSTITRLSTGHGFPDNNGKQRRCEIEARPLLDNFEQDRLKTPAGLIVCFNPRSARVNAVLRSPALCPDLRRCKA